MNTQSGILAPDISMAGDSPKKGSRRRLEQLFDSGNFSEVAEHVKIRGEETPLICGFGKISGVLTYAFAQSGALGKAHVIKMEKIYEMAKKSGAPIVGIYDSHGIDLSQGIQVLDSCGQLILSQYQLAGRVPQIALVLGPCIGVNAILASSADFLIFSELGSFFSKPPALEEENTVGTARLIASAGVAHLIATDDQEAIKQARTIIDICYNSKKDNFTPPTDVGEYFSEVSLDSYNADVTVKGIFDGDSIIELFSEFGKNVIGAMATLEGSPVGIIATRGKAINADDSTKIARLVMTWNSLDIPIISLVNTEGMTADEISAARDMAKISRVFAEADVVKLCVITGRAYGAGYVTLASRGANCDYIAAWPSAIISPLPPKTAVAFLHGGMISSSRSREEIEAEYIENHASAHHAAEQGVVDEIIKPAETRRFIKNMLTVLKNKSQSNRPTKRGSIPL